MKKRFLYPIFFAIAILVSLSVLPAYSANITLGVPERAQEHSNWCWAASAKAVLDYYGKNVSQCTIANWAWSRSDCCGNNTFYWSHPCNLSNAMYGTAGSLQSIMNHWGVSSTPIARALTWGEVLLNINARKPFVMRFGWTGGGGHFLVGYGYDNTSPGYVHYMDPLPGNGYTKSTYSYVAGSASHSWTHSLQVTTAAPATISAQVTRLWPVSSALPGQSRTLWAEVRNTGTGALPSDAKVWYYVRGPGFAKYVGSASAAGLTVGGLRWHSINWAIPASAIPGTYTYWTRVYRSSTPISAWSKSQTFTVISGSATSAEVTRLWPVSNAQPGQTRALWAEVRNKSTVALPSDAKVWYYVRGPGFAKWVGSASAAGLTVGGLRWHSINWAIPASATPGTYTYWARVYRSSTPISAWSTTQAFIVGSSVAGFNEQFKGGSAGSWIRNSGFWSVFNNEYYYTGGVVNRFSLSTYNANYGNLDYSAKIFRNSSASNLASGLLIRASGAVNSNNGRLANFYWFPITRGGYYSVWKYVNGVESALKSWGFSAAVNKDSASNILRVIANGSTMRFYINGTLVWTGTDTSLTSGRAGVGMYRDSASTANGFWVDWATLTVPASGSGNISQEVSSEQAALNVADEISDSDSGSGFMTGKGYTP